MPKLLLIDGYSLLYRAFYSSPPFATKAGEPTGALYGFIRMVTRLLDENAPDFAVVALDPPGGTFRHDADSTYKANRSETPDDLKIQQKLVRELLDGLSIPRYEHDGFEADDVIGTLAKTGAAKGEDVIIVTGDGDQLQIADEAIRVLLTRKGVSDLDSYGPKEVEARYGFAPKYVPDFKGLKGDASDNIPGVPGIGDKTASSLLQKFGSLDGIYERIEEVTPPRIQNLLKTYEEQAFHSRTMATIIVDLPIDKQPEEFRYDPFDKEKCKKAAETAHRFEFKSLASRYEKSASGVSVESAAVVEIKEFSVSSEIVSSEAALNWLQSEVVPTSFSIAESGIILAREGGVKIVKAPVAELKTWFESEAPKITHDSKAAYKTLLKSDIKLNGVVADTLLMSYLIDPARQNHPVAFMADKFLKYKLPEIVAPKKKSKTVSLFDEEPTDDEIDALRDVEAATTAVLLELEPVLRQEVNERGQEKVFSELELPLVDVLANIECVGMLLDPQKLRDLGAKLETDARRLESEIWELAGEKFNIGSPKQLQVILYEKMGLEKGRNTKTGASTDVFTLERLAEQNPIAGKILEYRGTTKLKSTYVDALLNLLDSETHRVHSSLNQTGAVSGRLSSTDPNLQNVPIRTEQGRLIRKAFIAPKDYVFMSADYSQIELRILAHITGDAPLVDAFAVGEDVHSRTAAALFGVAAKDVDKEMRRKAKMTNYAIAYGVSGFGLAKQLGAGTNAGEAKEFIDRYFETLPGVKAYIDDTLKLAKVNGYVETLMGRRRPLPDINANAFQVRSGAERTAINHPIQGTAADIMKMAMLAVFKEMRERQLKSSMTMQVHDELVFEVHNSEIEIMTELIRRNMTQVPAKRLELKVPLVADIGIGSDWDSTKSVQAVVEEVEASTAGQLSLEM
jgi:DNA polymerase-1